MVRPCKTIAPALEQLASEMAGRLRVAKLNVDDNPVTANRFGVSSIPTLLVLKDGAEVDRIVERFRRQRSCAAWSRCLVRASPARFRRQHNWRSVPFIPRSGLPYFGVSQFSQGPTFVQRKAERRLKGGCSHDWLPHIAASRKLTKSAPPSPGRCPKNRRVCKQIHG